MHAISIIYTELNHAALVKIFIIADLLGVTPKEAAETYLAAVAKKANSKSAA